MAGMERPQKVTFGELRSCGVRGLLIYCADYKCSHSIEMMADRWPDDVRLSDIGASLRLPGLRQAWRRRPAEFPLEREAESAAWVIDEVTRRLVGGAGVAARTWCC